MILSVVVLTMGDRPFELARALTSLQKQTVTELDVLIVVNASQDDGVDCGGARKIRAGKNLGVAGGRNLGAIHAYGELIFFLDDDAWLPDPGTLERVSTRFDRDPSLGILSLRVESPDGHTQRHHVPRLRVGNSRRSSEVTTFLGGASALRQQVISEVGGFPEEFVYAHEETSLAWRAIDAGWRVEYEGQLRVIHPHVEPIRHAGARHLAARNRVLLARRHLPVLVGALYVANWLLITLLRDPRGARDNLRGTVDGLRWPEVPRSPIGWRTVARMLRLGRPPII